MPLFLSLSRSVSSAPLPVSLSDHEETRHRHNSNAFTPVHPFTLSIHVGLSLVRTGREHDDAVNS